MVTGLIVVILVLTWMKGISYPIAVVQAGQSLEHSRQGDLPSTLAAIGKAIATAPDVPVCYNWRVSVYKDYQGYTQGPRVQL